MRSGDAGGKEKRRGEGGGSVFGRVVLRQAASRRRPESEGGGEAESVRGVAEEDRGGEGHEARGKDTSQLVPCNKFVATIKHPTKFCSAQRRHLFSCFLAPPPRMQERGRRGGRKRGQGQWDRGKGGEAGQTEGGEEGQREDRGDREKGKGGRGDR